MTSASFRESMNSLGWSRSSNASPTTNTRGGPGTRPTTTTYHDDDEPILSRLAALNPFGGGFGNEGHVRLPTTTTQHGDGPGAALPAPSRREEEEGWFVRE